MAQERSKTVLFLALYSVLFGTIFNYTLSLMASPYIVADLGGAMTLRLIPLLFTAWEMH